MKKKKTTTTKKEEEENSDLISCPTGVIPLGLAEWLIYLQGWVILLPSSSSFHCCNLQRARTDKETQTDLVRVPPKSSPIKKQVAERQKKEALKDEHPHTANGSITLILGGGPVLLSPTTQTAPDHRAAARED